MTLIVEDGSIIADANSYVDLDYIRAFALARGVTLSETDSEVEAQSQIAIDYLEGKRAQYQGRKTDPENQELQFPRIGVRIDNYLIPSDSIPKELKQAQCRLIMAIADDVDIFPTQSGEGFIIEDTVGPITTKYSESVRSSLHPTLTAVDDLLAPLCGQRFALTSLRV